MIAASTWKVLFQQFQDGALLFTIDSSYKLIILYYIVIWNRVDNYTSIKYVPVY